MFQEPQENQNQEIPRSNLATNEVCSQTGPYKSSSTPSIILFIFKGQPFPNAPTATSATGTATTWTLLTASS
jgi:hypothetical protein